MARIFKPSKAPRGSISRTSGQAPKQLSIIDLAADGRGIAKEGNKTVFVAGALPNERVSVEHYRRHRRFDSCQAKSILTPSAYRVEPICKHFATCGGCQLQHLNHEQQMNYKTASVLSLLQRTAKLEPESEVTTITSNFYGYRSRARMVVNSQQRLSFRRQGSDNLVPIEQCPVLVPELQQLVYHLNNWLQTLPKKHGVTHVDLVASQRGAVAVLRHLSPVKDEWRKSLREIPADVLLQPTKAPELECVNGADAIPTYEYPLFADLDLEFHPLDFTQVNREMNSAMVELAVEWMDVSPEDRIADFFCGIGNFTVPLAKRADLVLGVEGVGSMLVRGRANCARNQVGNVEFIAADLDTDTVLKTLHQHRINKVLLDPPRTGAKLICEQIAQHAVQRLIYISCNPATLARDAAILSTNYRLQKLTVLDMFPQTAHVEAMALFVPNNGDS